MTNRGSFLLLCLLVVVSVSLARFENGKINIAVLTLDPFSWPGGPDAYTGPLKTDSAALILSYKFWESEVNTRGGIVVGGNPMLVNITIVQTGNNNATQSAATVQAVESGDFDFYFGPFSSAWSINVAKAMLPYTNTFVLLGHAAATSVFQCQDRPTERPPCSAANAKRFQRVLGVTPVGEQFLDAPLNLVALSGAKTIAGWYQDEDFTRGVAEGAFLTAQSSNLNLLGGGPLAVPLNATLADYRIIASKMKDLNPDIVVAGSRVKSCVWFLKACKEIDWLPKGLFTTLCANDPSLQSTLISEQLNISDARYIIDSSVWDRRLKGPEFNDPVNYHFPPSTELTSSESFYQRYSEFSNGTYLDMTSAPLAMGMAYALEEAITKTGSIDPILVFQAFPTILMNSFFGKIAFNGFGHNDAKNVANVQLNSEHGLELISPLSASTASMIYPIPTWSERVWVKRPFDYAGEKAVAVIVGLAILFSIVMAVLTFVYRSTKAIVASSPLFLFIMLTGSVMLYAGILTWTLTTSDALCMAHWWLIGIGFILMFGSLLVKAWRISRIFNDKDLSVIRISNSDLLIAVGVALAIELVLLIVWTAAGRSKAERRPTDIIRPSLDYMVCTTTTVGTVILSIAAAYKGLIMLAGVWLSISTWRIKYSVYNESRAIAFSMYNLFFFLVLAVIVQLVINGPTQRKAQFLVRSFMILLGTFIPIAVLFLPKFYRTVTLNTDNVGTNSRTGKNSTGGGTGGGTKTSSDGPKLESEMTDVKTVERLERQNSRLKAEVKQLRAEISKLRGDNA